VEEAYGMVVEDVDVDVVETYAPSAPRRTGASPKAATAWGDRGSMSRIQLELRNLDKYQLDLPFLQARGRQGRKREKP